jgi:hypothetical protein
MPAVTAPTPRMRQAAVVSVQAGPPQTVTMHLAGDTSTDIVGIRHLDSYVPVAGDTVWVLQNDSDYLIIGRLGVAGAASQTTITDADTTTTGVITSITYAPSAVVVGVAFVAPPSGRVLVHLHGRLRIVAIANAFVQGFCAVAIRTGATIGSGTAVDSTPDDDRALEVQNATNVTGSQGRFAASCVFPLSGLTPGSDYNAQAEQRVSGAGHELDLTYRAVTIQPVL